MTAPNLFASATAVGHTSTVKPADTSRNALVAAPASGTTYKINQIIAANIDGSAAYNATVELRLAEGSTYAALASTISVPPNASLIVSDKTTSFYLVDTGVSGEASTLWATSSTASKLVFTVSYDAITT